MELILVVMLYHAISQYSVLTIDVY